MEKLEESFEGLLHKSVSKGYFIGLIGAAIFLACPFAVLDYNYEKEAQEIHKIYERMVRQDPENIVRLSIYEELTYLQQQGYAPESWAVRFLKKRGRDYYTVPDGFERKR